MARDGERTLPAPLEIPGQGTSLEGIEKELVQMALKQTRGNQTRAARLLDISRDALRYRIKKFSLAENEHPATDTQASNQAVR